MFASWLQLANISLNIFESFWCVLFNRSVFFVPTIVESNTESCDGKIMKGCERITHGKRSFKKGERVIIQSRLVAATCHTI
jgi:hypothetical protein